jgi:hypothetical protein
MSVSRTVVELIAGFIIALAVTISGRKPKATPVQVDCYCQVCPSPTPMPEPTPDPCTDVRSENEELKRRIKELEGGDS